MKIAVLVGSLRKDSYNMKIARYIQERYKDDMEFNIVDLGSYPVFNEDLEKNVPENIKKDREDIKSSDGVLIVTPEYNHSIPGGLKNALDWYSRDNFCMMKKPYLLMGASTGSIGTARSQAHLRQVLNAGAFQMYSFPGNEFLFANVQDKLDDDGNIVDEGTLTRLDKRIKEFKNFIDKLS